MTAVRSRTRETEARETPAAPSHGRQRVRQGTDRYHFDPAIVPDGFVYQWKRYAVLGQEDPAYLAELHQVGFEPVPAERHDGLFLPKGTKGPIIIGGQILMDRPIDLEQEARAEEKYKADAQVRGSREQFGMTPTARGFEGAHETSSQKVRNATFVRSSSERVEAPRPKHEIAID